MLKVDSINIRGCLTCRLSVVDAKLNEQATLLFIEHHKANAKLIFNEQPKNSQQFYFFFFF